MFLSVQFSVYFLMLFRIDDTLKLQKWGLKEAHCTMNKQIGVNTGHIPATTRRSREGSGWKGGYRGQTELKGARLTGGDGGEAGLSGACSCLDETPWSPLPTTSHLFPSPLNLILLQGERHPPQKGLN